MPAMIFVGPAAVVEEIVRRLGQRHYADGAVDHVLDCHLLLRFPKEIGSRVAGHIDGNSQSGNRTTLHRLCIAAIVRIHKHYISIVALPENSAVVQTFPLGANLRLVARNESAKCLPM
jgi:hypothetical protein